MDIVTLALAKKYADEKLTNGKVDLTGYAKEDYVDAEIEELNKKIVQETGKLSEEKVDQKELENYALKDEIPTVPVQSVNGKTGAVQLSASEVGALPNSTKIPANTSDLKNNSGFITKTVTDLANYYLKTEVYTQEEIDNKLSAIPKFAIEVVSTLPTANISETTVYLIASGNEEHNLYTEYIYVDGQWEYLGKQTVDLTNYVKRAELSNYYLKSEMDSLLTTIRNSIPTQLSQFTEDSTHRTVTDTEKKTWNAKSNFSGAYGDLTGKPTIPTKTSQLTNDSNFVDKSVTDKLSQEIDGLPTETVLYTAQTLTEAQKAQARANIGATAGEEVEFADSVEWLNENGDTSKKYVLPDGFIYEYTEKHVTEPHNANTGTINLRPNVNVSMDTALVTESGVLISEPIPFSSDWTASGETVRALSTVTISGIDKLVSKYVSPIGLYYYEADGTFIVYMKASQMASLGKPSNTEDLSLPVSLMIKDSNFSKTSWSNVGYVRILLGISTSGDITADDIADVKINCAYYDFEGNVTGWYSTGQQHSNDLATQQNSADISALKERMNTAEADIEELQTAIENVSIVDISTGQKLYAVGDSITYGYGVGGNDYSWVKHVIDINGYDSTNCVNLGQSGLGFNTTSTSENTIADIVDGTDFSGADIVTVALGINDWKNYNARLTAIWEGMEYCFNKIRTDNPCCKIFFICPFNASIANTTFDTFYCLGYKEGGSNTEVPYNHTLQDFINMMKAKFEEDTFKAFHINVIDMTECPAINRYNITTALMDNLHPTAETHIALGKEIARRIALT